MVDSSGSQGTSLRMDSQDSTEVEWGSSRQPSISLREWDIPIEDLKIGQKNWFWAIQYSSSRKLAWRYRN